MPVGLFGRVSYKIPQYCRFHIQITSDLAPELRQCFVLSNVSHFFSRIAYVKRAYAFRLRNLDTSIGLLGAPRCRNRQSPRAPAEDRVHALRVPNVDMNRARRWRDSCPAGGVPEASVGSGEGLDIYCSTVPCVLLDRESVTNYVYVDLRAFHDAPRGITPTPRAISARIPGGIVPPAQRERIRFRISGRRDDTPIGEHSPLGRVPGERLGVASWV